MASSIKTEEEIAIMREGGRRAAAVLRELAGLTKAGLQTQVYEGAAVELFRKNDLSSSVYHYQGTFPSHLCISVNDEVVHGIPGEYELKAGDLVGIDVTVSYRGLVVDTAITVSVGAVTPEAQRLLEDTKRALDAGISAVKDGVTTTDVGRAIETVLEQHQYGIVRELVGHGVGHSMHEDPNMPNYDDGTRGSVLKSGMTVTIEPMVTLGGWKVSMKKDEWPVKTADGSLAAHFEHTILVTNVGAEILTK